MCATPRCANKFASEHLSVDYEACVEDLQSNKKIKEEQF